MEHGTKLADGVRIILQSEVTRRVTGVRKDALLASNITATNEGIHVMGRKFKDLDFEGEERERLDAMREKVGQQVPISSSYHHGPRPILQSIEGDHATLRYPNGTIITNIPLRDLVDDSNYWRSMSSSR